MPNRSGVFEHEGCRAWPVVRPDRAIPKLDRNLFEIGSEKLVQKFERRGNFRNRRR